MANERDGQGPRRLPGPRFLSAAEAVRAIPDGATLAIEASGGGLVEPSALIRALGDRFREAGTPTDLTVVFCTGIGDKEGSGLDILAERGLMRRAIGGHYGMSPGLQRMVAAGEVEAFNLPQGVIAQLYREIAAGRPGVVTKAGIGTFCDPRLDGGRLSEGPSEPLVCVVELAGQEWLLYRSFPIHVAFIRGTTIDEAGNLTLEHEAAKLGLLSLAMACRNSGGTIIAQAERVAERRTLNARNVVVPGHLIDVAVVVPDQTQTCLDTYEPSLSGEIRIPSATLPRLPMSERRVIAERAARELKLGDVANLGVGMADGVAAVLAEIGRLDEVVLTVEQGLVGGVPARGVIFGAVWNPDAFLDAAAQFDFYDGGGLDVTCLGFAEVDADGNVNASRVGDAVFGVGGFVNISSSARKVVFCGTFTSGGLQVDVGSETVTIQREGQYRKFVDRVKQVTFDAASARVSGRQVLYVTERAVFELGARGLELVEVAAGVDIERDVLGQMAFRPHIRQPVRQMVWAAKEEPLVDRTILEAPLGRAG